MSAIQLTIVINKTWRCRPGQCHVCQEYPIKTKFNLTDSFETCWKVLKRVEKSPVRHTQTCQPLTTFG